MVTGCKMNKQKIIELKSGAYSAKINLSRGANCISLRNEKYNAMLLREPDYSRELDNPYLYGMPILFPVNRIAGANLNLMEEPMYFQLMSRLQGVICMEYYIRQNLN